MVDNKALSAVIADLRNQKKPNFGATTRKYVIDRTTLRRHFQAKQTAQVVSNLQAQSHFTWDMEMQLVECINIFLACSLLPMLQFVVNLVLEFFKEHVNKH